MGNVLLAQVDAAVPGLWEDRAVSSWEDGQDNKGRESASGAWMQNACSGQ